MTPRKPPNVSVPTWVERQIRDAARSGAFDDLPGAGKPLPNLDRTHDDLAWLAAYLKRENVEIDALLPPALALAKEVEQLPLRLLRERSETRARELVEALNGRVLRALAAPQIGPPLRVRPVRVEEALEQWRADRQALDELAAEVAVAAEQPAPARQTRGRVLRRMRRTSRA